jgi:hypothetical protein
LLEPSRETREMDIALAMAFSFWDLVVANKKPFALPVQAEAPTPAPLAASATVAAVPPALPTVVSEALAASAGPLFASTRDPAGRAD